MVGIPSSLRTLASVPAENIWGLTWGAGRLVVGVTGMTVQ